MSNVLINIITWIKHDYRTYPLRFIIETAAWALSIGCSVTMALTVPTPPLVFIYPVFICQCVMYGLASYSRRSFGMLANCGLLVTIDSIGLVRMILQ